MGGETIFCLSPLPSLTGSFDTLKVAFHQLVFILSKKKLLFIIPQ